ncbi:hypothetical protein DMUE_1044 [Dictyocoela muelleri]|nr:hypothetical protein DMUE_1044 [Dictyocoela muelleri]
MKFHTDGYPSYPRVAENLCLDNKVSLHNNSFICTDGTHTNNIDNYCAHLKSTMRKEDGVMRINIHNWLGEYTFKRIFLMKADREEYFIFFKDILKLLLLIQ